MVEVDVFTDMLTGDAIGTALTGAIANAGTHGGQGWSGTPGGMTIGGASSSRRLKQSVMVAGSSQFQLPAPSRSMAYDHGSTGTFMTFFFSGGIRIISVGCFLTLGPHDQSPSGPLFDYLHIGGVITGQYGVVQLLGGGPPYALRIETNPGGTTQHSGNIVVTPGATYWIAFLVDFTNGTAKLNVYNTDSSFVGAVTTSQTTGEDVLSMTVGNSEFGSDSGHTSFFENILVDWTNPVFPMVPGDEFLTTGAYRLQ